jgi:hypothetical protein
MGAGGMSAAMVPVACGGSPLKRAGSWLQPAAQQAISASAITRGCGPKWIHPMAKPMASSRTQQQTA